MVASACCSHQLRLLQALNRAILNHLGRNALEIGNHVATHDGDQLTACVASILGYGTGLLLNTIPCGSNRADVRLFRSSDDGKTWQDALTIELCEFAYGCFVELDDGDVGCLYET